MKPFISDQTDAARCHYYYGPQLTHCEGGRVIVKGYICPHCGSRDPSSYCSAPKDRLVTGEG